MSRAPLNDIHPNTDLLKGFDGVHCWNLATSAQVLPHNINTDELSQVYPACAWIYFEASSQHVLVLGDAEGQVSAWDLGSSDGREVCFITNLAL